MVYYTTTTATVNAVLGLAALEKHTRSRSTASSGGGKRGAEAHKKPRKLRVCALLDKVEGALQLREHESLWGEGAPISLTLICAAEIHDDLYRQVRPRRDPRCRTKRNPLLTHPGILGVLRVWRRVHASAE